MTHMVASTKLPPAFWARWPKWLKYGTVCILIVIGFQMITAFCFYTSQSSDPYSDLDGIGCLPYAVPFMLPFLFLPFTDTASEVWLGFNNELMIVLFWFWIGVLIGFPYESMWKKLKATFCKRTSK